MSERIGGHSGEKLQPKLDHFERHEGHGHSAETIKDAVEKQHETLKHAQAAVENLAHSKHEVKQHRESKAAETRHDTPIASKQIKDQKYGHTLKSVQHRLNPAERALSKVVHQPLLESMSEAGEKVVRPNAVLGGSIMAFVVSSGFLYFARANGWSYNFFIFLLAFGIGFGIGLAIEFGLRVLIGRRGVLE